MSTAAQPNILFVHVDELRYPMHFPNHIETADEFMQQYMPNVHARLWQPGVVFSRHYTAAADCSAGRSTFVTGLYAQQTNLMIVRGTKLAEPGKTPIEAPALKPDFPTYGKLLNACGYDTPYIGKWHLSDAPGPEDPLPYLSDYGFQGLTNPDPNGVAGQGIGDAPPLISDTGIAEQAIGWLANRALPGAPDNPFCLTVGFINPHDKQWFWSGPEAATFAGAYKDLGVTPFSGELQEIISKLPPQPSVNLPIESNPPPCGYDLPDNWQCKAQMNQSGCPSLVPYFSALTDFTCGGISDDPTEQNFTTQSSLLYEGWNAVFAPYSYWTRALDMYTLAITSVDTAIGLLLDSIPAALQENMVIVFTSDHGEYASSHGLQGKGFTGYEETINVPLIVRDFTGRYTQSEDVVRTQVTSHVDLLRMFASLGYGGDSWMTGDYATMYGGRVDLLAILQNPTAAGRAFAAYTCDEVFLPPAINPTAPSHVTAFIFPEGKLTLFADWPAGEPIVQAETFYYDWTSPLGQLELQSSPSPYGTNVILAMIAQEIHAPLPAQYQSAQAEALVDYLVYAGLIAVGVEAAVCLSAVNPTGCQTSQPIYTPTVNAPQAAA
jgi:arylsulfatase A-like enzyme